MHFLKAFRDRSGGKIPDGGKYALIVLLAGVLLLVWPQEKSRTAEKEEEPFAAAYLARQQAEMESILSRIEGAGKLHLMLTLAADGTTELAGDLTQRRSSADAQTSEQEKKTVVLNRGSGYQEAVVTQRTMPVYKGALVVCEGGGDASVRLAVTEAVRVLTGLRSDCITVVRGCV